MEKSVIELTKMKKTVISKILIPIVAAAMLLPYEYCIAVPATTREFDIFQPDGTAFRARLGGDEFMKILTTSDGCTIGMGEDRWYYYGWYESDGTVTLSDSKVGQPVPSDIKAKSMAIPYESLAAAAASKRASVMDTGRTRKNILAETRAARGALYTKSGENVIEKHGIVILAQFQDLKFQDGHTREAFENLLTEPGYNRNGATGSAMDYFNDQFDGYFSFSFDVSDIVTVSGNYADYGANKSNGDDINAHEFIAEACKAADSRIDFSRYDDNGDGEVDNVFVFFAGGDEADGAGTDHIWSHAWYLADGAGINLTLDGVVINRYACTSELRRTDTGNEYTLAGIGTFCHEYSHTLGLSDYYDTDYISSGGRSVALWSHTALMDGGNFNNSGNTPPNLNAPERDEIQDEGIFEPEILTAGTHTLEPIDVSGKYYKMETDTESEYFLFECRAERGWDKYIGGSGLLIYHIDKSGRNSGYSPSYGKNLTAAERWQYNEVNCRPAYLCADLIEANPNARVTLGQSEAIPLSSIPQIFFPYTAGSTSSTSFTPETDPAFVFRSGTESSLAITGIEKSGDNIVLTVTEYTGKVPEPASVSAEIFQDAAIITWASSTGHDGKAVIEWSESAGGEKYSAEIEKGYETGQYSYTIEGLTPRTAYKTNIYFENDGVAGTKKECNFTTKSPRSQHYPFIYLFNIKSNGDGTYPAGSKFPLRLYNAYDADGIDWYMDGVQISTDASGYYIPETSGELRAEIHYDDGTTSIVTKYIVIK